MSAISSQIPMTWNKITVLNQGLSFLEEKGNQLEVKCAALKTFQAGEERQQAVKEFKAVVKSVKQDIKRLQFSVELLLIERSSDERLTKINEASLLALAHCKTLLEPLPFQGKRGVALCMTSMSALFGATLSDAVTKGANLRSCPLSTTYDDTAFNLFSLALIPVAISVFYNAACAYQLKSGVEDTREAFKNAIAAAKAV